MAHPDNWRRRYSEENQRQIDEIRRKYGPRSPENIAKRERAIRTAIAHRRREKEQEYLNQLSWISKRLVFFWLLTLAMFALFVWRYEWFFWLIPFMAIGVSICLPLFIWVLFEWLETWL